MVFVARMKFQKKALEKSQFHPLESLCGVLQQNSLRIPSVLSMFYAAAAGKEAVLSLQLSLLVPANNCHAKHWDKDREIVFAFLSVLPSLTSWQTRKKQNAYWKQRGARWRSREHRGRRGTQREGLVMGTLSAPLETAGPEEEATGRVRQRHEVGGHWEEKELAIKELIRVASNWVLKGRPGECGVREKQTQRNVQQGKSEVSHWPKVGLEWGRRNQEDPEHRAGGIWAKGDTERRQFMVKGNPLSDIGSEHKQSWHSALLVCH